jgi:hypothetical protein
MMRGVLLCLTLGFLVGPAIAQEWQPVTEELIRSEKPGYGNLCGVVVDHATGHVYVNLSDRGLYRSTDGGTSWQRLGKPFKGRTEWPGCLMLDPLGSKRLVTTVVYGAPILVSPDRGETWKALDNKSSHVDWCAVDWSDADLKFILTLKHESGGLLLVSRDGGKRFDEVGKGYGPAWIFDGQTAVVAEEKSKAKPRPRLLRTTDGARTFQPCGDYHARALPRWHKDALYWVVEGALISTKDRGKTWQKVSDVKDGRFGPIFGNPEQLFVLTGAGIIESTDGGRSWSKPIAVPKAMKGISTLSWLEYDPTRDVLYVMRMDSQLFRLKSRK